MADTPAPAQTEAAADQPKAKSKLPLIIGAVVLVAALGGGGYWFFVVRAKAAAAKGSEGGEAHAKEEKPGKSAKSAKAAEEESSDDEEAADEEAASEEHATGKKKPFKFTPPNDKEVKHVIELQPFVVNLADKEGSYYLRLTLSIGVGESKEEKPDPLFTTRVRNAILAVLTTKTSEDVLTPEGKAALRRELLSATRKAVEEPKVHAIYITDLIVQL